MSKSLCHLSGSKLNLWIKLLFLPVVSFLAVAHYHVLYMHICMHECTWMWYMCMHVGGYMHRGWRSRPSMLLYYVLHYFYSLREGLSTHLELGWWPASLSDLDVFSSHDISWAKPNLTFFMDSGILASNHLWYQWMMSLLWHQWMFLIPTFPILLIFTS